MAKSKRHKSNEAYNEMQTTIRLLRKSYSKDDPRLKETIKNARRIYLRTKQPVREFYDSRMDHFVGHAMTRKRVKAYCNHA